MKRIIGFFLLLLFPNDLFCNEANDIIVRLNYLDPIQYRMALDDLSKSFPDRFNVDRNILSLLQQASERKPSLIRQIKEGSSV